jgi:hypothetical protein
MRLQQAHFRGGPSVGGSTNTFEVCAWPILAHQMR